MIKFFVCVLEQILVMVFVVLGISLAEVLVVFSLGYYKSRVANFIELVSVIVIISLFSQAIAVKESLLLLSVSSFVIGFFPALIVKSLFSLYFKRAHPELRLSEKSMIVQLIRSMRAEKMPKNKISRVLGRVGINSERYLKFF